MEAAVICPICESEAKSLDVLGDWDGYDCSTHGKFKVAGTVAATRVKAGRAQWEAALKQAKARCQHDEWPLIKDGDFEGER